MSIPDFLLGMLVGTIVTWLSIAVTLFLAYKSIARRLKAKNPGKLMLVLGALSLAGTAAGIIASKFNGKKHEKKKKR